MPFPEEVFALMKAEQERLGEIFASENPAYLEKLENFAELLTHQDGSGLLGFVFFYCNDENKEISYVSLIATTPPARGRGIGRSLLSHVLQISKQRGFASCQLQVDKRNEVAYNFYRQAGFKVIKDCGEKYLMSIATQ